MKKETHWFLDWFNEDYLNLYANRDSSEAEKHVDFLCNHLNLNSNDKILDLGCGSGRHANLLGKFGYHILGIDTSEFLIREAIKNSKDVPTVKFICRDMRNITDLGPFDLILSMFTSFGYFEADEQNQDILNIISQSLKPGSRFFMDYLYAPHVIENLIPFENIVVKDEEVLITRKVVRDRVVKTIEFPGRSYQESVKLYDPETLSKMLQRAGFTIVNQWGGYDSEPLTSSSSRLLTLSTK